MPISQRAIIGAVERIRAAVQQVDDDAELVTVRIDDLSTILEFGSDLLEAAPKTAS